MMTGFLEQLPRLELVTGQVVCRHVDRLRHRTAVHKPEHITDWTDLPDVASIQAEQDAEPSQPEVPILRRSTRVSVAYTTILSWRFPYLKEEECSNLYEHEHT